MESFAVIFDMDGLMLDTERVSRLAWVQALQEMGYYLGEQDYLRLVGRTVADARVTLAELYGAGFPFDRAFRRCQECYEADIEKNGIPVKAGLYDLLNFLELNQVPKAVASSTYQEFVTYKLNLANVGQRFSTVVSGDMVENGKPAPDLFLLAARRLSVLPQNCIVLEDSEAGITAAHNAGMLPVMIPDLKQPEPETWAKAWCVLPSLREVIPLMKEFLDHGLPQRRP